MMHLFCMAANSLFKASTTSTSTGEGGERVDLVHGFEGKNIPEQQGAVGCRNHVLSECRPAQRPHTRGGLAVAPKHLAGDTSRHIEKTDRAVCPRHHQCVSLSHVQHLRYPGLGHGVVGALLSGLGEQHLVFLFHAHLCALCELVVQLQHVHRAPLVPRRYIHHHHFSGESRGVEGQRVAAVEALDVCREGCHIGIPTAHILGAYIVHSNARVCAADAQQTSASSGQRAVMATFNWERCPLADIIAHFALSSFSMPPMQLLLEDAALVPMRDVRHQLKCVGVPQQHLPVPASRDDHLARFLDIHHAVDGVPVVHAEALLLLLRGQHQPRCIRATAEATPLLGCDQVVGEV
eukprot:CAMPEP_0173168806 /NCGR_PEP_ID=MMETSP1141-20130122/353_1 /TAXON_ID=483371 /ORGANISM="non described non described, Strain CCMP2298" /LENGTH=349 /DNA_ID=CAMNT_0014090563 /DNA_START=608 /DNA_END=1657 /DNA_ORIENTATION=+